MEKYHVHIYRTDALAEVEVEAENELEARQIAHDMLINKPYSDVNETDFKKPDTEFIIMAFEEDKK